MGKKSFYKRVGKKIIEIREKYGESIPELSKKSGLSENTLNSIENGRRDIKVSELFKISKALNVRISSFLGTVNNFV